MNGFDPDAPLIGRDGLEYEDFASYLVGKPAICWRNQRIVNFRESGRSEQAIRLWIEGYDHEAKDFAFREEREALRREAFEADGGGGLSFNHYGAAVRPRHKRAVAAVAAVYPITPKLEPW